MTVDLTWHLAVALGLFLVLAVGLSALARLGTAKDAAIGSVRAVLQLAAVSFIIVVCMRNIWLSWLFVLLMLAVAVWTTASRTKTKHCLGWVTLAVLAGAVPVIAIVFLSGAVPYNGQALIPVAGILIGNMMTAHTLVGRRAFAQLRDAKGTYEAALSIGLTRGEAIGEIVQPILREALVPTLDTTKTVGLVTLPGAFVGVLLGGGSPLQAGAAQVLVLVAIVAGQTCVVYAAYRLMRAGKDLPDDLRVALQP